MLHGSPSHLLHRFLPLFFLAEISSKLTFFAQSFGNRDLLHPGDTRMGMRITMESVLPSSKDFLLSLSTDFNSRQCSAWWGFCVHFRCEQSIPLWRINSHDSDHILSWRRSVTPAAGIGGVCTRIQWLALTFVLEVLLNVLKWILSSLDYQYFELAIGENWIKRIDAHLTRTKGAFKMSWAGVACIVLQVKR